MRNFKKEILKQTVNLKFIGQISYSLKTTMQLFNKQKYNELNLNSLFKIPNQTLQTELISVNSLNHSNESKIEIVDQYQSASQHDNIPNAKIPYVSRYTKPLYPIYSL